MKIKHIIKSLGLLMGMVLASEGWGKCPEILLTTRTYDRQALKQVNTLHEQNGETIYFCQTDNTSSQYHTTINETQLVSLSGIDDGVESIAFDAVSHLDLLNNNNIVIRGNRQISNLPLNPLSISHPVSASGYGVFNFYQRELPSGFHRNTLTSWCNGQLGSNISYQEIVDYLGLNANSVFSFSNISGQASWQKGSDNIIATTKVKVKDANGYLLPMNVALIWLNKGDSGQYYSIQNGDNRAVFCWVNVGVEMTLDTADGDFRHSGNFETKLQVLTN